MSAVVALVLAALAFAFALADSALLAESFEDGGDARRWIGVLPGTYTGTVFIPAGSPPLTIFGLGCCPGAQRLPRGPEAGGQQVPRLQVGLRAVEEGPVVEHVVAHPPSVRPRRRCPRCASIGA